MTLHTEHTIRILIVLIIIYYVIAHTIQLANKMYGPGGEYFKIQTKGCNYGLMVHYDNLDDTLLHAIALIPVLIH